MQYAEKLYFSKNQADRVLITVGVQIWRYNLIIVRSTPVQYPTVNTPSLPENLSTLKLDVYGWQWKNPISLVFSKLVLDSVKVKILLISWHFLEFFSLRPDPPIHWHPYFLVYQRCSGGAYLGQVSFTSDLQFTSFEISNVFIAAESTILGCFWSVFLDVTHRNVVKFICKFDQWCNAT